MAQVAWPAIKYKCEKCGMEQFEEDSLDYGCYENKAVRQDHIQCENCGHDNHVIQEL